VTSFRLNLETTGQTADILHPVRTGFSARAQSHERWRLRGHLAKFKDESGRTDNLVHLCY